MTIIAIGIPRILRALYGDVLDVGDKEKAAAFFRRAAAVREIAAGIFDEKERQTVLKFVAECEALTLAKARKTQKRPRH